MQVNNHSQRLGVEECCERIKGIQESKIRQNGQRDRQLRVDGGREELSVPWRILDGLNSNLSPNIFSGESCRT